MKWTKRLAPVLGVILSLGLLGSVAMADTTPSDFSTQVEALTNQIVQLRAQTETLKDQLAQQTATNKGLEQQIRTALVGSLPEQVKAARAALKQAYESQIEPLRQQLSDLHLKLEAAKLAGDKDTVKALEQQMDQVREQLKSARQALQPQRDALKDLRTQLSNARKSYRAVIDQAKPLWEQEKDLRSQVRTVEKDKQAAWAAFSTAAKAKDQAGILSALNQVITDKQQILGLLQQILGLKQQVTQILQAGLPKA